MSNEPEYLDKSAYMADMLSLPISLEVVARYWNCIVNREEYDAAVEVMKEKMQQAKEYVMDQPKSYWEDDSWKRGIYHFSVEILMLNVKDYTRYKLEQLKSEQEVENCHKRIATVKKQLAGARKNLKKKQSDVKKWETEISELM